METKQESKTIKELLVYKIHNVLKVNPEYQRGPVWTSAQQKKFIDSALRGYPLPLIYLHDRTIIIDGMVAPSYEVIDGQQRTDALYAFTMNSFELFNPADKKDDREAKFPEFIKKENCAWAKRRYRDLSPEDKERFDNTILTIVKIKTDNEEEVMDLFIRLQAGSPLNAQEKRDALPGGFTNFVLEFGGKPVKKPDVSLYPGHDLFARTLKINNKRGKARLICAQTGMLFFEKPTYIDVGTNSIDNYYYKNLIFDINNEKVKDFRKILDKLNVMFYNYKGKKIIQQEVLHLVLLVDTLMKEYVSGWETSFVSAFNNFRQEVILAKKPKKGEYYSNFGMLTSTSTNNPSSIRTRHEFFSRKMIEYIKPIKKDEKRLFNETDREYIWQKYNKTCAVCFKEIEWKDLEIHHVMEHHSGGATLLENAAPVHNHCHPKGDEAVERFVEDWVTIKFKL
jgi:5-methylcytosine-specific restriction endonuclease McrA